MSLSLLLLLAWLCRAWLKMLSFDDAYMFYRYAVNITQGLGISWNPDGVHTYGMTSQLWVFFILPLTVLPLTPGHALQLASWFVGCAALATMAFTVMRRARYYIPLLPFIVVQAVLSVDGALVERVRVTRRVAFGIAVTLLAYIGLRPIEFVAERKYVARVVPAPIAVPKLPVAARDSIAPGKWFPIVPAIALAVAALPIEQAVRAAWTTLYPSRSITDYIVSDRYVPETESRPQPAS